MNATLAAAGVPHPAAAALQNGTLGIGFSGSGFLLFYFLGVLQSLQSAGVRLNTTRMAGSSGGALTAMSAGCGGTAPSDLLRDMVNTSSGCRAAGACYHTLDTAVRRQLNKTLPADAAARCSGRVWVAVTDVKEPGPDTASLISNFASRQDLIDAGAASSFIPFWSGPAPFTRLRGSRVYDGGFTARLPCPPGVSYCVTVQAQPYGAPASGVTEQSITQLRSLARFGAGNNTTAGAPAPELDPQPEPLPAEVDIAPGKFSPLPLPRALWDASSLQQPPNATVAAALYDLGVSDAAAWAARAGLGNASAAAAAGGSGGNVTGGSGSSTVGRAIGALPGAARGLLASLVSKRR